MNIEVKKCERCGKDHTVYVQRFKKSPVRIGSEEYWYWGTCMNTKEPVIMKIITIPDK